MIRASTMSTVSILESFLLAFAPLGIRTSPFRPLQVTFRWCLLPRPESRSGARGRKVAGYRDAQRDGAMEGLQDGGGTTIGGLGLVLGQLSAGWFLLRAAMAGKRDWSSFHAVDFLVSRLVRCGTGYEP